MPEVKDAADWVRGGNAAEGNRNDDDNAAKRAFDSGRGMLSSVEWVVSESGQDRVKQRTSGESLRRRRREIVEVVVSRSCECGQR